MELNSFIESTNLKPTITGKDVDVLVQEALDNNFLGVCVPPFWVKRAVREKGNSDLQIVTVIGYPLGYQMTESKMMEIDKAIEDGVDELDIVMNLSAFQDGMNWVKIELAKCSKVIHDSHLVMKVIVETDLWDQNQLLDTIKLVSDAGSDFFKTSTGYHRPPVTTDEIKFIRKHLPSNVGVKASGGIKTKSHALDLVNAGADRLGTSSGLQIIQG